MERSVNRLIKKGSLKRGRFCRNGGDQAATHAHLYTSFMHEHSK